MAAAVAQSWSATASAVASLAVTVTGFAATDVAVVVTTVFENVSVATGTPSDNGSTPNTYTRRTTTEATWDATNRQLTGIADAVISHAPTTITGRPSTGSTDMSVAVLRCTGVDNTTPFEIGNASKTPTTSSPVTGAVNTSAGDLVIVAETHDGADTTLTQAAGWTLAVENESNAIATFNVAYQVFSGAQTGLTHTWTNGASRDVSTSIAGYKAAAGGGTQAIVPATINATSAVSSTVAKVAEVKPATVNATSAVTASVAKVALVKPASISATSLVTATVAALKHITAATVNATSNVTAALSGGSGGTAAPSGDFPFIVLLLGG